MFSALKFVAAAAIVALFGGFLLAGLFTMQQGDEVLLAAVSASPTTEATSEPTEAPTTLVRTDILPGAELTVEEVEPGVFHVVSDGVRTWFGGDIVAGHDGSILLVRHGDSDVRGSFSRLGSDESFTFPEGWDTRLVVSPDGTVWVSGTRRGSTRGSEVRRTHSLTDGKWTRRLRTEAFGGPHGLVVGPDGIIWTTRPAAGEKEGVVVTRLEPDGWQRLKKRAPRYGDLVVTEGGEVWLVGNVGRILLRDDDDPWQELGGGSLWRHREGAGGWEEVTVDAMTVTPFGNPVEVGSDGTVWFAGVEPLMVDGQPVPDEDEAWSPKPGDAYLRRFDGTDWQRWGPTDGVPALGYGTGLVLNQAPDGELWMARDYQQAMWEDNHEGSCSEHWGVARFDDTSWQYFLPGHCTSSVDMTPDGSLWFKARSGDSDTIPRDLYVITPEAAAHAE